MRVVSVYNRYVSRGGEDEVFESDVRLLLDGGHGVIPVTVKTSVPSGRERLAFAAEAIWSRRWAGRISGLVRAFEPDVLHVYNSFPRLSPAILRAGHALGVPTVLTVQNYRLACPRANLYRDGGVCESCLGRAVAWPGILRACYHGSRVQTAVVAAVTSAHRLLGTWSENVDVYLVASEFSRGKLAEAGLPERKILVKPNFRSDPGEGEAGGEYALYVGRMSREKGVGTLLRAIRDMPEIPFVLAGDGPLLDEGEMEAGRLPESTTVLGRVANEEVLALMQGARLLVFPSEWYEGLPVTLIEAMACGLPIVGSRIGAVAEMVRDDLNGVLFAPGDADDLRRAVTSLWPDGSRLARLRRGAREQFLERYDRDDHLDLLLEVYRRARSVHETDSGREGARAS